MKKPLPRSKYTKRIAWSVWNNQQKRKERINLSESRWYWNLNGASYGALVSVIEFAGDFTLSAKLSPTTTSWYFVAHTNTTTDRIVFSTNEWWVQINGTFTALESTDNSFNTDGLPHVILVERLSDDVVIYVDGIANTAATTNTGTFTVNSIASKYGGATGVSFFTGTISDFVATGITNQAYTTLNFSLSTYAPDNSYQFIDSANGVVMQLHNALPEDFTQELS